MKMNKPEEIAKKIRDNGEALLRSKNILTKLQNLGEVYFTGSYALDLMTWNDIDMQIIVKESLDPLQALSQFYLEIAQDSDFIEAQLINFTGNYKPKMPRGVYLGLKIDSPEFNGMWKLDLWALAPFDFNLNRSLIEQLKSKLDQTQRSLILNLKHELMKPTGRVPQMGSHWLYQAVLLNGLKDQDSIFDYLRKQGVCIESATHAGG